jgi:hypothetical protein
MMQAAASPNLRRSLDSCSRGWGWWRGEDRFVANSKTMAPRNDNAADENPAAFFIRKKNLPKYDK